MSVELECGLPQQLKVTVGFNVRNDSDLSQLARALSIPDHVLESIQWDKHNFVDKAGSVITKWERQTGAQVTEKRFRQLLIASNLAHFLSSQPPSTSSTAMDTKLNEADLLKAYLCYVIEKTQYIDMIGTSTASGRRLLLDRIYVSLRIDRTVPYERAQQVEQVDSEMKALLAAKGVSWDRLSPDEKVQQMQDYLSELPLSSVDSSIVDTCREEPVACAFKENQALVILGDPGSGKTTIARWLALKLATAMLHESTVVTVPQHQVFLTSVADEKEFDMGPSKLPVFVRMSDFARYLANPNSISSKGDYALLDFLGTLNHSSCRLRDCGGKELFGQHLHELIYKRFFDGKVSLILDGLDEVVVVHVRRQVVECVKQLIDMCFEKPGPMAQNQIVVTSRIAGYSVLPILQERVAHGIVQRMSREAIDKFIDCWMIAQCKSSYAVHTPPPAETLQWAAELKKAIYDRHRPSIFLLASNPLLVTLIAMMFSPKGELPKERARLYASSIHYLVEMWREHFVGG